MCLQISVSLENSCGIEKNHIASAVFFCLLLKKQGMHGGDTNSKFSVMRNK